MDLVRIQLATNALLDAAFAQLHTQSIHVLCNRCQRPAHLDAPAGGSLLVGHEREEFPLARGVGRCVAGSATSDHAVTWSRCHAARLCCSHECARDAVSASLNSLVQRTVEPRDLDRCLSHSECAPSPRIHNTASLVMAARSAGGGAGTILYDLSSQLGMSEPGFVFVCFGASYAVGYCAGRMNLRSR